MLKRETSISRPSLDLPLFISPSGSQTRDLRVWHESNSEFLKNALRMHGAVLFRDFALPDAAAFRDAFSAVAGAPLPYVERSSPRRSVADGIFTSTTYPNEREIRLHNEQSYNVNFPRLIGFYCEQAASRGGETPLADVRNVYARLDKVRLRQIIEHGYCYVRNFGSHFGYSWEEAFQRDDAEGVEQYCSENDISFEWLDYRGGTLRTRQCRPAVARHPLTGEAVWFNHLAFFHPLSLDADIYEMLLEELAPHQFPHATFHADGSAIDAEAVTHLLDAYRAEERLFEWQVGDMLLIDNMLAAHARKSYSGDRRILVAMADRRSWSSVRL